MTALFGGKANLLDIAAQFFREDEWNPQMVEEKPWILLKFRGSNGTWNCLANVMEEQEQLVFYSILDAKVPEEQRAPMSEFITRANYGLVMGNFEMDFSDGEVRYKTSVDVEGGELAPTMVKNLAYSNVLTVDRYYGGLMSVMYGGKTPAQAVAEIES